MDSNLFKGYKDMNSSQNTEKPLKLNFTVFWNVPKNIEEAAKQQGAKGKDSKSADVYVWDKEATHSYTKNPIILMRRLWKSDLSESGN